MEVVAALVDLHFDSLIDGVVFRLRLDGDADEHPGIRVRRGYLVDHAEGGVADLLAGEPKVVFRRGGESHQQAVLHHETGLLVRRRVFVARDARPSRKIFAVEQLTVGAHEQRAEAEQRYQQTRHTPIVRRHKLF